MASYNFATSNNNNSNNNKSSRHSNNKSPENTNNDNNYYKLAAPLLSAFDLPAQQLAAKVPISSSRSGPPGHNRPLRIQASDSSRAAHLSIPFKLISKVQKFTYAALQAAALTLLVLFCSSWIALASAAVAASDTRQQDAPQYATLLLEANNAEDLAAAGTLLPELFNTSSAFLAAITELNGNVSGSSSGTTTTTTASSAVSPTSIATRDSAVRRHSSTNSNSVDGTANGSSSGNYSSINRPQYSGLSTTAAFIATNAYESISSSLANVSLGPLEAELDSPTGEFDVPPIHAILVTIVLLFVILGTVVGNVLVCIAVCMVRKLRRPCNYLLVSLALSDLCVAVLVMPMALLYEVLEKWNFGPLLCDIWVSFDVLCCTASILNLCAISVDRYLAITKPLEYGVKRTPRRMMLCVALVWLAAACISLPPLLILGNEHVDEHGEPICAVCQNFAYQIYATLGSFYIPLAVMLFVYYQIFRAARRIVLEEKRAQTHLQHALNGTGSPPPPGHTDLGSGNGQRHSSYGNTSLSYSTCGGLSGHGGGGGGVGGVAGGCGGGGGSGSSGLLGSPHHKKLRFQLAKEKKASTTLGIIMSAFTICWLPFFILALIRPFVESETTHVPQSLSSLFLWLGYANSLLNPIIYATLNRDFRKPFQEILYFRCSSLNTMMRENYYQDQYGEPPSQRVMLGDERHGARESFL